MKNTSLNDADMPLTPTMSAHFFLSGRDFDVDEVTKVIGIAPTETWRQSRRELVARRDLPTQCWKFGYKNRPCESVDDIVSEVLGAIWPNRVRLLEYLENTPLDCGVECAVSIYGERPIYELLSETVKKIADLDCRFILDIYDYSTE